MVEHASVEIRGPLVGHTMQRTMLKRLHEADKLPSTILFAGLEGIGKKRVAHELARTVLCSDTSAPYGGCGRCKCCHLFDSGSFPDWITFDCLDREHFDLDRLRELLRTLNIRPFMGRSRIILFDHADRLSTQAANLLLKSLEEPRPGNYFIFVCANPGMLPRTVLSRCQVWFFDALTDDQIREILSARNMSAELLPKLLRVADGSLANLSQLDQEVEEWQDRFLSLQRIVQGDVNAAIALAAAIGKDKERLHSRVLLLRAVTRHLMHQSENADSAARWSGCLLDLLAAERLIFERNLGATYVLSLVLCKVADRGAYTRSLRGDKLLDQVTV